MIQTGVPSTVYHCHQVTQVHRDWVDAVKCPNVIGHPIFLCPSHKLVDMFDSIPLLLQQLQKNFFL